jgi:hypothetical protein
MTRWGLAALPLLIVATGCIDQPRSQLINSSGYQQTALSTSHSFDPRERANEAIQQRVRLVADRVVRANQQAGLRPTFVAVGTPQPEIFHRGGGAYPWQVFISAGLVDGCKTEAQLAAVVALELGKIVAEREALASPGTRRGPTRLPPGDVAFNDAAQRYNAPDNQAFVDQVRFESKIYPTSKTPPLPVPDALARGYLTKAGFPAIALDEVAPLLRQAAENFVVEKQFGDTARKPAGPVELGPPVPARAGNTPPR